jgi:ribose/xylose/arabinose/galactoside ABC-type transport system permease subunit
MSKGNINYKYLKRRKNWFQRNWQAVLIYIGITVFVLAVLAVAAFAVLKYTPAGSWLFEKIANL